MNQLISLVETLKIAGGRVKLIIARVRVKTHEMYDKTAHSEGFLL